MPVKLNDKNIQTNYIKNILSQFPLPLYEPLEEGGLVIEGHNYLYRGKIVKAKGLESSSGQSQSVEVPTAQVGKALNFQYVYGEDQVGRLEVVDDYRWGEDLGVMSSTYLSPDDRYDISTHEYLGRYLRVLRSERQLDLMPFYNCFLPKNILGYTASTKQQGGRELFTIEYGTDESWDYYLSPVLPGYTYTIGLDSALGFKAAYVFARNQKIAIAPTKMLHGLSWSGLTFSQAESFLSRPLKIQALLPRWQDSNDEQAVAEIRPWWYQLHLLLMIPRGLQTSVVVMEGDYQRASQKYVNGDIPSKITFSTTEEDGPSVETQQLMSPLFLNQVNTGSSWCFSPRLIEYLTGNVICPEDAFWQNTVNVQNYLKQVLGAAYDKLQVGRPGVWSPEMQRYLYNQAIGKRGTSGMVSRVDINGYVDREVESLLKGGYYW